ncbi:MAG: hypothetical protein LBM07_03340, partial [Culturomica sp.]|nr:hypothetical protein [Culturomica sp.]
MTFFNILVNGAQLTPPNVAASDISYFIEAENELMPGTGMGYYQMIGNINADGTTPAENIDKSTSYIDVVYGITIGIDFDDFGGTQDISPTAFSLRATFKYRAPNGVEYTTTKTFAKNGWSYNNVEEIDFDVPTVAPAVFAMTAPDTAYCVGQETTVPITYENGTVSSASVANVIPTPATGSVTMAGDYSFTASANVPAGVYKVCLAASDGTNSALDTATLTVKAPPTFPTLPILTDACEGATVDITGGLTAPSGLTYSYLDASGAVVPSPTTYTPASDGEFSFSIVVDSTGGCSDTTGTYTLTVNPKPDAPTLAAQQDCETVNLYDAVTVVAGNTYEYRLSTNSTYAALTDPTNITTKGATTYYVRAVSGDACSSDSSSVDVTIYGLPTLPSVSNLPAVCEGATVDITGGLTAPSGLTYSYLDASGTPVSSPTTYTPASAGTYSFRIAVDSTATGCKDTTSTYTLTVNPKPDAPSLAKTTLTDCETVNLYTALDVSETGNYQYRISTGSYATLNNPTNITTAGTTNYYIREVSNGCYSDSVEVEVKVNTLPVFTALANGNNPESITEGQSITLTVGSASSDSIKYVWSAIGAAPTPSVTTPQYAPASSGLSSNLTEASYRYVATGTDTTGCVSSDTVAITVGAPVPNPTLAMVTGDTICLGGELNLVATYANLKAATQYKLKWDIDGDLTGLSLALETVSGSDGSVTLDVSAAGLGVGEYTVTAELLQSDGVTSLNPVAQATYKVKVNDLPAAPTLATSTLTACESVDLYSALTPVGGIAYKYKKDGDVNYTALTSPTNVKVTDTYYIWAVNTAGCMSADSAEVGVTIYGLPTLPTVSNLPAVCEGVTVDISATQSASLNYVYLDVTSGTPVVVGTPEAYTPASAGTYSFRIAVDSAATSCKDTTVVYTLTVNPKPSTPTVDAEIDGCVSVNLYSALTPVGGKTYQYRISTGSYTTLNNPTNITTAGTTTYYIREVSNGCYSDSVEVEVKVNTLPV